MGVSQHIGPLVLVVNTETETGPGFVLLLTDRRRKQRLSLRARGGEPVRFSEFGTVLLAGEGEPGEEFLERVEEEYGAVEIL